MSTIDKLDATGYKPGDVKEIDGLKRICIVTAITVGPDEYETRLRWHLPTTRRQIIAVRNHK